MEMWTTLRFAPTCPHFHSPYCYGLGRLTTGNRKDFLNGIV
jgi:hypothetical protein